MTVLTKLINRLRGARHIGRKRLEMELRNGEPEIRLVPLLADKEADFLDIGANDGVYSFCALPHFRQVIAVEPHPRFRKWLSRLLKPNGRVITSALSDTAGKAELHIPQASDADITTRSSLQHDANPGYPQRTVAVPVTTVDALGLDRLAVVKIDVEGHELKVLRGAIQTLQRDKPVCIVESEERHNAGGIAQVFDFFRSIGYDIWFVHRGLICEGRQFDAVTLQQSGNWKTVTGERSPDYVNNFIFVHPANASGLDKIRQFLASAAT